MFPGNVEPKQQLEMDKNKFTELIKKNVRDDASSYKYDLHFFLETYHKHLVRTCEQDIPLNLCLPNQHFIRKK